MPKLPPEDDENASTGDQEGAARAEVDGEGGFQARDEGADADDHGEFLIPWSVDQTAILLGHLEDRNRELHDFIQRVGVPASLARRLEVKAFNERGWLIIKRISHFELHGVIDG
jgi:hypothetical protein